MRDLKKISKLLYYIYGAIIIVALVMSLNSTFKLGLFGYTPISTSFLYWLLAAFMSSAFLIYPISEKASKDKLPFYDIILWALSLVICSYFALNAVNISLLGWSFLAPTLPTVFAVILWGLMLEALRRTSGNIIFFLALLLSFYPIFAGSMPGILKGMQYDLFTTARSHSMSLNSILGAPLQSMSLLTGFMIFGVVLNSTGGGDFFSDFALSIFGKKRGGSAKVSIVSSALFGSLSGSPTSNTVTIGSIAIPSMKKSGYDEIYSGAIQACAATGGSIMPPVMGAAAFIMASFMGVPYGDIVLAAIIPAVLYYSGLFFQSEAHAGKLNLQPAKPEDIKPMKDVLKAGWPFILVLFILIYFLLGLRIESYAPYFATLFLLIIVVIRKKLNKKMLEKILYDIGKTLCDLVCVLGGVGLIVGALSVTGTALAFSREIVMLIGDSVFLLLLAGAITSFILGMGMTSTACYIFLSIVLVPALTRYGISPMAANFYVLYWGIISFITPPVALASITAAKIAGGDTMETGIKSMQLGIVTYFIPFLFVYEEALLGQGPTSYVVYVFIKTLFAVYLISAGLEGYLTRVEIRLNAVERAIFIVAACLIAIPRFGDMLGFVISVVLLVILFIKKRKIIKDSLSEGEI